MSNQTDDGGKRVKQSSKAALLSALVFPGLGHLLLRQTVRGWTLLLVSLAAISVVVRIAFLQAESIMGRVASGNISLDAVAIGEAAAHAASASDERLSGISYLVFAACWLFGIIDAYRIGSH